jgi:hypothetical protein
MLSRPGEFNPNNFGISLLPAMMSDYGKKTSRHESKARALKKS